MLRALILSFILTATSAWGFYPPDEKSRALFESLEGKEKEITEFLQSQVTSTNEFANNYEVKLTKVPKVEGQPISEWVPVINENSRKLIVELRITDEGLKSPLVMAEEIMRLNQIQSLSFSHPYEWAETVANAKAGSVRAAEKLARMDYENAKEVKTWLESNMTFFKDGTDPAKVEEWSKARLSEAEARYTPISKSAKAEQARLEAEWNKMKPTFSELEKQDQKFNHLVMNNDRAGARKMLETYLPWPLMEPSEKNAWRTWLDAMEKPDLSKRELVFRGMDGYPILKSPGSEKVGVFSSVLAMNQGNYTRRLRSLQTSREKVGRMEYYDVDSEGPKFPKDQPSIIDQMRNHAANPQSSPFISVSDNTIATRFGSQERMAILIDERRLIPNAMAFGYGEIERLIPLVIFPDEVVHYEDRSKMTEAFVKDDEFLKVVGEKLGRPVTATEINAGVDETEFLKRGFDRLNDDLLNPAGASIKGEVCLVGNSCNCIRTALDKLLLAP
jgi:hypothetical protein